MAWGCSSLKNQIQCFLAKPQTLRLKVSMLANILGKWKACLGGRHDLLLLIGNISVMALYNEGNCYCGQAGSDKQRCLGGPGESESISSQVISHFIPSLLIFAPRSFSLGQII